MSYVDAGYSICLSILFLYAVSLVLRRRRLSRAATIAESDEAARASTIEPPPAGPPAGPTGGSFGPGGR